jgi:hypothetical protein
LSTISMIVIESVSKANASGIAVVRPYLIRGWELAFEGKQERLQTGLFVARLAGTEPATA